MQLQAQILILLLYISFYEYHKIRISPLIGKFIPAGKLKRDKVEKGLRNIHYDQKIVPTNMHTNCNPLKLELPNLFTSFRVFVKLPEKETKTQAR